MYINRSTEQIVLCVGLLLFNIMHIRFIQISHLGAVCSLTLLNNINIIWIWFFFHFNRNRHLDCFKHGAIESKASMNFLHMTLLQMWIHFCIQERNCWVISYACFQLSILSVFPSGYTDFHFHNQCVWAPAASHLPNTWRYWSLSFYPC